jgi:hypothetical protein
MYGIIENGTLIARFAAPMTVRSNRPAFVSDALSLKRHVSLRTAQRWEIETSVVPLSDGAQDLFVTLVTKGISGTVQVRVPQNYGVIKARNLSVTVPTASALQNASQITVANHNGFIPKGTFLKFANHGKLYMATSNLTNNGTLNIFPELRSTISNTILLHKDDVLVDFKFDTDIVQGMRYSDGILMDVDTIKLLEAL